MIIWHLADIHFGKVFSSTIENFKKKATSIDLNPAVIVIAGDLFDSSLYFDEPATKEAIAFLNFLKTIAKRKVIVIKGTPSHDRDNLETLKSVFIDDNKIEIITTFQDCDRFACVPEPTIDNIENAIKYLNETDKKYLIIHGTIEGAILSSNITLSDLGHAGFSKSFFKRFKLVMAGHIHKPQKLDGINGYYAGSLGRFKFGEPEAKGFYIHNTEKITKPQFIEIESPTFTTQEFKTVDELLSYVEANEFNQEEPIRLIVHEPLPQRLNLPTSVKLEVRLENQAVTTENEDLLKVVGEEPKSLREKIEAYIEKKLKYKITPELASIITEVLNELNGGAE